MTAITQTGIGHQVSQLPKKLNAVKTSLEEAMCTLGAGSGFLELERLISQAIDEAHFNYCLMEDSLDQDL